MDRKRTQQAAIVSMVVLALVCSVAAQQQQQQQPQPIAADPPKFVECKMTTTKPNPTQESYVFGKCIVAKFGAYIALEAPNKITNYTEFSGGKVSNMSICEPNATNPKLVVQFACGQLEFEFQKVDTSVSVKAINGFYLPDGKNTTISNATEMFKIDQGHYYKCNTEQTIVVKDSTKLVLSNVALEAFRGNTTGTDFYKMPEECPLDSAGASDLVRIGVGISLALLAALVLVAYFVGRRRWAERSSYESV